MNASESKLITKHETLSERRRRCVPWLLGISFYHSRARKLDPAIVTPKRRLAADGRSWVRMMLCILDGIWYKSEVKLEVSRLT